ncbi:MAG TPA: response regulator [Gemmatimonadales bacterium]
MTNATVLVVEDHPMNLELASDVLRSAGFTVLEAATAAEGLRAAGEQLPDLVLLDIRLPDMSGLEVLLRLRADPRTAAIPVVALTAHAMKGDEEAARSAGCIGYITKPINTRTFPSEVAQFLTREGQERGGITR